MTFLSVFLCPFLGKILTNSAPEQNSETQKVYAHDALKMLTFSVKKMTSILPCLHKLRFHSSILVRSKDLSAVECKK